MNISIVIPLLNEAESLPQLMNSIAGVMDKRGETYEVVLVDDGSTDNSFEVCHGLHEKMRGKIRLFRFSRNYGKSAALSVGIEKARGEIIITMDADLQDDPEAIPDLISKLNEGWDLVSGWKKKRHDPISKTLPSKIWNIMTSLLSGIRLHDFNCGFKIYRSYVAKNLEIYGERHRYLPALAHWEGYKVTEMAVPHHPRKFGKSKYGMTRFVKGFLDLITILFLKKYLKNPLHFFGLLGIVLFLSGSGVLGYFGIDWIITKEMHLRPLVLLSMGAVIMGIQFVSIGLIGEMITHVAPSENNYKIRDTLE